jgi:hypothetical protein
MLRAEKSARLDYLLALRAALRLFVGAHCPAWRRPEKRRAGLIKINVGRSDSAGTAGAPADKASARGGGRKAVLAAIEAVLVAKRVPEKQREAVLAAATETLAQRIRDGQAPGVKVYDKAAQRPTVMPTPEVQRTRERVAPVR